MPCFGATFDENSVPPWTRGDFRGDWGRDRDNLLWVVHPDTPPGASRPLSFHATPPRREFSEERNHASQNGKNHYSGR